MPEIPEFPQGGSSKATQATGPRLVLRALLPLQQCLPALQPMVSEKGAQGRQHPEPGPAVHGRPQVTPQIRASPPSPQGTHSSFQHQINRNQCGWRGTTGRQHPLSLGVVREGFKEEFQCAKYRMRSQGFPNEFCITAKAGSRRSCQPSTISGRSVHASDFGGNSMMGRPNGDHTCLAAKAYLKAFSCNASHDSHHSSRKFFMSISKNVKSCHQKLSGTWGHFP